MSEPSAPIHTLHYVSTTGYGNAATQIKVAAILSIVSGSFSIIYGLIELGIAIFAYLVSIGKIGPTMPASTFPASTPPSSSDLLMMGAIFGGAILINLVCGGLQLGAGICLLKRTRRAFALAIAGIVAGFVATFAYYPCCVPGILSLGNAVYTLVILCLEMPRRYIRGQSPN